MGDPFEGRPFPRGPLVGAALLVGASIVLAALGRYADVGRTALPAGTPVAAYDLRFADRKDGSVAVTTAAGQPVGELASGTGGFARGVMRSLTRARKREGIGQETPFRLTRWTDGRLSLDDPATGEHVNLEVFGPTNSAVFAKLWLAADEAAHAQRTADAGRT
jgi:putative photosynthetic complex assembly protein